MKEESLNSSLINLIVRGLILESEQENAEFESAMRNIDDESFFELVFHDFSSVSKSEVKLNEADSLIFHDELRIEGYSRDVSDLKCEREKSSMKEEIDADLDHDIEISSKPSRSKIKILWIIVIAILSAVILWLNLA